MNDLPPKTSVIATKSVSMKFSASRELASLFEAFRSMCNDAIRIAIRERPRNKFRLIGLAYPRLKEYELHTHYILTACEVAYSVCRNPRRKSVPYVRKPFLKVDSQSYRLDHMVLRIASTPRDFIFLTLQASEYHLSLIDDEALSKGSITVTPSSLSIVLTKEVKPLEPTGSVGVDINERNTTVSSTEGWSLQFDEPGEVAEIKERYKEIRFRVAKRIRGDRRIGKRLLAKYGRRERSRTLNRIHRITKQIVTHAVEHRFDIKMEELKGIRKLYRKGNRQGISFRGRMNSWVFGETQRQIDYKAKWGGISVCYVNPRGTSRNCPNCGSRVAPLAERKLYCPKCDVTWDRDVLASRNIMACAVPQGRPSRGSCEGERGDDGSNPRSRWREGSTTG